jgi:cysteine desulfurase
MAAPRVYLDHAAAAPLAPEAEAAMLAALRTFQGNPSSPHAEGRAAKDALEASRSQVAATLGCRPREVVFTSGGTEAANLGVTGAARARGEAGRRVVVSAIEHPCVLDAAVGLSALGFEVNRVPVDGQGRVDPDAFVEAADGAALACLMLANHETGNVLPVAAVAERLKSRRIPLLVDAALGPGRLDVAPAALGADLLVLSGHKFGAPKGIGVLVVRRPTRVEPQLRGGLQEERARPGTENVAAAAGFAAALETAVRERAGRVAALEGATAAFLAALAPLRGWRRLGDGAAALPGLVTLELDGVEGEAVTINLDLKGIAVATGSTCALGGTDVSPSLLAMGLSARRAASTVRVSPGPSTSAEDARRAGQALVDVVERLRALARR